MTRISGKLSAKAKLKAYFTGHVGEILTSDTLREVGGISEWARRARELRDEEGLDIVSHHDLAALKPNEYMLRSHEIRPAFARDISKETRALVLDRNGQTCQMCGASAGEMHPYDPNRKTRLHIGHILTSRSVERTICQTCVRYVQSATKGLRTSPCPGPTSSSSKPRYAGRLSVFKLTS